MNTTHEHAAAVDTKIAETYRAVVTAQGEFVLQGYYLANCLSAAAHNSGHPEFDYPENTSKRRGRKPVILASEALAFWDSIKAEAEIADDYYFGQGYVGGVVAKAEAAVANLNATTDAYVEAEKRYEGWSRFFLVPGGHIHSTLNCSTCNNGRDATSFAWLPELSGLTEAGAVAEHGAILCTVCYPSAPVEWTNHYETLADDKCVGSGTWDFDHKTARTGYYSGNLGTCNHCGERITLTKTNKLRKHDKTEVA